MGDGQERHRRTPEVRIKVVTDLRTTHARLRTDFVFRHLSPDYAATGPLRRYLSVKRRELIAGVGSLAVVGGAGYVALNGVDLGDDGLPLTVQTLDAPGSEAGKRPVPAPGKPTVLDLFATWCVPCSAQMESLTALHEEFGDDVAFISVTNEGFGDNLTADDVRKWWADHDGAWTVGHDPESRLMKVLGAGGLPYLAVFDADGTATWTHRGLASESNLRAQITAVL